MKEYLGNPTTIKELYDALMKLPKEEIYDFHQKEHAELFGIYMDLSRLP